VPDDDRMLERLGRALAPPPARPDEAESRMVRQVALRLRGRWTRGKNPPVSSVPERDWTVTQLPPAILRAPVSATAYAGPDSGGRCPEGDIRLLA
jgi:hypothetical protein